MGVKIALNILGLAPGSSQEEVKKAYRRLVKQHHPDAGGDADTFHKITKAYEVLQKQGTNIGVVVTHKTIFDVEVE